MIREWFSSTSFFRKNIRIRNLNVRISCAYTSILLTFSLSVSHRIKLCPGSSSSLSFGFPFRWISFLVLFYQQRFRYHTGTVPQFQLCTCVHVRCTDALTTVCRDVVLEPEIRRNPFLHEYLILLRSVTTSQIIQYRDDMFTRETMCGDKSTRTCFLIQVYVVPLGHSACTTVLVEFMDAQVIVVTLTLYHQPCFTGDYFPSHE